MLSFLFRHLLESTLFCFFIMALAQCYHRRAAVRHAIWLVGIGKFAVPSVLLTATGAQIAFLWPAQSWFSVIAVKASAWLIAFLRILPVSTGQGSAALTRSVLLVWALGAAVISIVWRTQLQSKAHFWTVCTNEENEAFLRACRTLPARTDVQLHCFEEAIGPALLGIRRPVIAIPKGLSQQLTHREFEAVLLHELAHLRRRDNLASAAVHGLVCIFWFHPLLWWMEKLLRIERERACDELVIACGTAPQTYVNGIIKVCRFHTWQPVPGISAMLGSDLQRRLELIRKRPLYRPISYVPRLLIAGLAALMPVVPIAGGYCEGCVSNGQDTIHLNPCSGEKAPQGHTNTKHSCAE